MPIPMPRLSNSSRRPWNFDVLEDGNCQYHRNFTEKMLLDLCHSWRPSPFRLQTSGSRKAKSPQTRFPTCSDSSAPTRTLMIWVTWSPFKQSVHIKIAIVWCQVQYESIWINMGLWWFVMVCVSSPTALLVALPMSVIFCASGMCLITASEDAQAAWRLIRDLETPRLRSWRFGWDPHPTRDTHPATWVN